MKIVGIDFGTKRCGFAISNESKTMALPWTTTTGGFKAVIETLQKRKKEIESIVVGLPLLMNGTKADMAKLVEAFAKQLEIAAQVPVFLLDERLSSKQAEAALRETGQNRKTRTQKTDETAATFLLQSYLDKVSFPN